MASIAQRLKQQIRSHHRAFSLTVVAGLANGAATVVAAWALSKLINGLFLQSLSLENLRSELILFGAAAGIRALAIGLQEVFGNRLATGIKRQLRQRLIEQLTRLGPAYLKREHPGELVTTLLTGVETLDAYFSQYLPQMILSAAIPLLILILVFPMDVLSGVVFLVTAPLIPLFMILIGSMAKHKTERQWRTLQRLSAYFMDVLHGLSMLKVFNRSKEQVTVVARLSDQFRKHTMEVLRIAFLSAMVLEILASISTAIIAVEVGLRLLYARMAFQEALFILLLAPEFYLPMRLLGTRYHAGMEGLAAAERIFAILDTPLPPSSSGGSISVPTNAPIAFRQVTVHFADRPRPALDHVTLTIPSGKTTMILGPSGSGKTTLTDVLLGFISPDSGDITIGDVPLSRIHPSAWHQQVVRVNQRPHIFHQSLRFNLLPGGDTTDEAALWNVLALVELEEWARQLPRGLDTLLGEHGARLSGGQKQRLALARAILKPASYIILDEPTANLDAESENRILPRLLEYWKGKTLVLITHRLHITPLADRIILLHNGQVVEEGRPQELLNQPSRYRQLMHSGGRA